MCLNKQPPGLLLRDTEFEKSLLSRYLEILRSLRFIEKEVPVTEKYADKSKLGLYRIHDRFLQFWFRYVFPNRGRIEIGKRKEVLRGIKGDFDQYLSFVFEDVCREYCLELMRKGKIHFTAIGRWWHKNEEIDLVALDEENKQIYFGEVKWSKKPIGVDILDDLRRKAALVEWNRDKAGGAFHALFKIRLYRYDDPKGEKRGNRAHKW